MLRSIYALVLITCGLCALSPVLSAESASLALSKIKLPPGFKIEVYNDRVPSARSMTLSPNGVLFVGTRGDKVYAIRNGKVFTIASGLNMPNGVALRNGSLYVAEVSRILRYDGIEQKLDKPPRPVVVYDKFPTETHHGWKFIRFSPDGWLYVPVGAPCNVCDRSSDDPRFASITRLKPDGSQLEIFASGVRNTVGFDWDPRTKELWFTDNGRDLMGDDVPDDELNRAPKKGLHFGFPYCHAGNVADPEFSAGHPCSNYVAPEAKLGAHIAALGMRFYSGKMFPEKYRNAIFIAEHGSWNRTHKTGYRVVVAMLDRNGKIQSVEPFAQGWLQGEEAWGRPVDVEVMPDGSLLVSDDTAGAIYRISYSPHE